MGAFESQINERREAEQQLLEDAFIKAGGVVLGRKIAERISDQRIITNNAIDEIFKYFHCKTVEVPKTVKAEDQLDSAFSQEGSCGGKWSSRRDGTKTPTAPFLHSQRTMSLL